jgi:hypothetical protein
VTPAVAQLYPANGTTKVDPATSIQVVFARPVVLTGAGAVNFFSQSLLQNYTDTAANTLTETSNATVISVGLPSSLAALGTATGWQITISSGAVRGDGGLLFPGITWQFITNGDAHAAPWFLRWEGV